MIGYGEREQGRTKDLIRIEFLFNSKLILIKYLCAKTHEIHAQLMQMNRAKKFCLMPAGMVNCFIYR